MSTPHDLFDGLPGRELATRGMEDLARGIASEEACLVEIAAPRLARLGVEVGPVRSDAELRLYRLLSVKYGSDAYGRYNALIRRLISFCQALEGRISRQTA